MKGAVMKFKRLILLCVGFTMLFYGVKLAVQKVNMQQDKSEVQYGQNIN